MVFKVDRRRLLFISMFLSIYIFLAGQVYIDYKVRTDDFYANVGYEVGDEEVAWNLRHKISDTGTYSDWNCFNKKDDFSAGDWWNRDVQEIWSGTCLDIADLLYVDIEGWENDDDDLTHYNSGDDNYSSDTDSDLDISAHTRNTWEDIDREGHEYVNCGEQEDNNYYKVELDVWWNYTIPGDLSYTVESYGDTGPYILISKTSNNNYRILSWDYCVATQPNAIPGDASVVVSENTTSSSAVVGVLEANTTYYIRISGTNEAGTGNYTSDQIFTMPLSKPASQINSLTDITMESATVHCEVISNGGQAVTERGICWNTAGSPTISNSSISNGSGLGEYICSPNGLRPNQQYYIRAYAINSIGTSYSEQSTFTTTYDYFYRSSVSSGYWDQPSSWQCNDGSGWVAATEIPTSSNNIEISIQTGHQITIRSDLSIDDTVVETGATLVVSNGTITLCNGWDEDLIITGTLVNNGTINSEEGALVCYNGSNQTIEPLHYSKLSFDGSATGCTKTFSNGTTILDNPVDLNETITITGSSKNSVIIQSTSPGESGTQVFVVDAQDKTINLSDMTLKGGYGHFGGALYLDNGALYIDRCIIQNSKANYGGGIFIQSDTDCYINETIIQENESVNYGGGLFSLGHLYITKSLFLGNFADGFGGGIYVEGGFVEMSNSSMILNRNWDDGTCIYSNSYLDINFCTIISGYCLSDEDYPVTGIYGNSNVISLKNSIVSNNNVGRNDWYDMQGALASNENWSNNYIQSINSSYSAGNNSYTGDDFVLFSDEIPMFGDYGGSTLTVPISESSPLSDSGLYMEEFPYDQRGYIRHNPPSIGAFECDADSPLPVTLSLFTARYLNSIPTLRWKTQSETSNAGWNVYRGDSENVSESSMQNAELIVGAGTESEETSYTFFDPYPVKAGSDYWYWLESISYEGEIETFGPVILSVIDTEEEGDSPIVINPYGLQQNYPNPFNPDTQISFYLQESGYCVLNIYNVKGQLVKSLFNDRVENDVTYTINWDGTNNRGREVNSGVYFYSIKTKSYSQIKKMLLVK